MKRRPLDRNGGFSARTALPCPTGSRRPPRPPGSRSPVRLWDWRSAPLGGATPPASGQEAGTVVQARQVIETRPGTGEEVVLDAAGAELLDPDFDLGGGELHHVRPQVAVGARADDAHEDL